MTKYFERAFGAKAFILLLPALLYFPQTVVVAQNTVVPTRKILRAHSIDRDFEITGILSNSIWQQAEPTYIEYEYFPRDYESAPVKTEVRILYSQDYLYIGFRAFDPNPEKIRASISERDKIEGNDYVGIILDTYGNYQQAYDFAVNPLGVQRDAYRSGRGKDMSFDALWYSAAAINNSGYTAVIKIPFKSINFADKRVQEWSVQLYRYYPRHVLYKLTWTDINHNEASCILCQNGKLVNIRGIEAEDTIEFLPYVAGFQSSQLSDPANLKSGLNHGRARVRAGGSISYEPNSTMSFNAVINPDFSQVETDAAKISVNETFGLFYPEKRPFFLESAALFESGDRRTNLFYSRSINNPLAAAKFTQKTSRYSIAFLSAYDENTPLIIPGFYGSINLPTSINSYSNILRGKYNFGAESFVGGLITTRNQVGGANYLGSIDWQLRLAEKYYFNGQLGYSYTDEISDSTLFSGSSLYFGSSTYDMALNGEKYRGTFVKFGLDREAKYYDASVGYTSYSPTFQAHNGFVTEINRRSFNFSQGLSYYLNSDWLTRGRISMFGSWRYDFAGRFQERFINVRLVNHLIGQTRLELSYIPLNDERFRGKYFKGMHRWSVELQTKPAELISLGGEVNYGRFVYRINNPVEGQGYNLSANITLKPTNRLLVDFSYNYSTLKSIDGMQKFYSGNIVRLTSRFYFSRKLFFRLITQYNSFNSQLQIYPLIHYQINPFTRFYLGMTDYLKQPQWAGSLNQYYQVNRQFFVKFQYLIRY